MHTNLIQKPQKIFNRQNKTRQQRSHLARNSDKFARKWPQRSQDDQTKENRGWGWTTVAASQKMQRNVGEGWVLVTETSG